uniref:Rad60/SUMO-like domain-containing protein n=1 Tax=Anopheles atroparvus TaxID=41427 RepID=A0AAG5D121_ANOAO
MSAGNDIFGNLDDFLENYDDNYLETSKLSEVENDFDPNRNDNASLSVATSKSKVTKNKSTKKDQAEQSVVVPSVPVPAPPSASSVVLPPPAALSNAVDLTTISLHDEMQDLARMFVFVFFNKDPSVMMHLKNNRLYNPTKRSFTALNNTFHQAVPTTSSGIAKFRKRIEPIHSKLAQLYSLAEHFISVKSNTSTQSTPAARRRSRRLVNSTVDSSNVITLEDDGSFNGFGSTSLATGQRMDLTGVNSVIDVDAQPDVITLDSDDESSPLETLCRSANNSFESENYEMRIKIKWGNGIETFTHRKHQKFGDLITKLATKEAADSRSILLNMDDRIIYADDTPDSIGYKTYQFISGRVLRENAPICTQKTTTSSAGSNNILSLKVQLADRKVPLRLQMDKHQTMIVLVIKCAEELKCNPEEIKLYFDGELIDNGSKPEDLELEGDELLDVRFVR